MSDLDVSASRTIQAGSQHTASFDEGRFAPGSVIVERYRIVGLLGRGGMGEVYRADDLTLGHSVALKFLPDQVSGNRASLDRLLSEVRTARQVSHPNVCRVHDVGEADGRRFISMEYIDGEDLSVLLRRIGRLSPDKGLEIARQLCAGLAASHERGVLHRDLKPANIMLDGRGRVRITDFGLAMALRPDGQGEAELAGTPAYMAPEQLQGRSVSVQTDVYALGLVLYEVFTGRRFHDVNSLDELRDRHAHSSFPGLSTTDTMLDPAVSRVIERCLDPDPRRRPASCLQVAASLPGGDPLAAALAAGETPSPQLVAAAGDRGGLEPRTVGLLSLVVTLALAAFVATSGRWLPPRQFGMTRSADVLSVRSRDLLHAVGYTTAPVDRAHGFRYRLEAWFDPAIDARGQAWTALRSLPRAPVYFWYREDVAPLVLPWHARLGFESFGVPLRGVVPLAPENPPLEQGAAYVELGPGGELETLFVRPFPPGVPEPVTVPVDWARLFAEARLDPADFEPAEPSPTVPVAASSRRAWTQASVADPARRLRVEAAEAFGRPVLFRVVTPGMSADFGADIRRASRVDLVAMAMFLAAYMGGLFSCWRNLVLQRGDRRGAFRLARVTFGLTLLSALLTAHFSPRGLVGIVNGAVAFALFAAAWCWVFYLAIEPYIRRQWPRALIGWSRLMSGEWRDAAVGRELFLGGVTALVLLAVRSGVLDAAARVGIEPPAAWVNLSMQALGGLPHLASLVLQLVPMFVFVSLLWILLLVGLRRLVPRDALAVGILAVVTVGLEPPQHWVFLVMWGAFNVAVLVLMLRVGFLALVVEVAVYQAGVRFPVSFFDDGFVGPLAWFSLAVMLAPIVFGAWTALSGTSMFGSLAESGAGGRRVAS